MRSCPSVTDVDPAHSGVKHMNSVVPLLLCTLVYYIWNVLYENGSCGFYFITYNLNRYIFRNINAIGFLFLTQHTTPLLYVKIHFGVLHMRGTDVTRSDTL